MLRFAGRVCEPVTCSDTAGCLISMELNVFRWLGRWLVRTFLTAAVTTVVAYGADTVIFALRGSPTSTVMVQKFMGIPLKGQKEEFDYLGPAQVSCAVALFPHRGQDPCWRLRRNPNQWENL